MNKDKSLVEECFSHLLSLVDLMDILMYMQILSWRRLVEAELSINAGYPSTHAYATKQMLHSSYLLDHWRFVANDLDRSVSIISAPCSNSIRSASSCPVVLHRLLLPHRCGTTFCDSMSAMLMILGHRKTGSSCARLERNVPVWKTKRIYVLLNSLFFAFSSLTRLARIAAYSFCN